MAYMYQAALYCDACGADLRHAFPGDEFLGDSRQDSECFPCYVGDGGEADSPQHCERCRCFLRNQLNCDGSQYVLRQIWEKGLASESLREWAEFYGISGDDHPDEAEIIRDWKYGSWRLQMWDCNAPLTEAPRLGYRFSDGGIVIFLGEDIRCPRRRCTDSIEVLANTLFFLSLRPGDTDAEHFESYTPEQLAWADAHGEELGLVASEIEETIRIVRGIQNFKHLGTVSWGTHRNQDLIQKFLGLLEKLNPRDFAGLVADGMNGMPAELWQAYLDGTLWEREHAESPWWYSEEAAELVMILFDGLSNIAPDGVYFGAHEGDGADFGFWVDPEFLARAESLGLDPEEVRP